MKQINNKLTKVSTIVFSALIGVACGGGGGGTTPVTTTNVAPVAEAGTNLTVSRNFTVNLDGSASSDADADDLTFTWTQTAGPDVTGGAGSLSGEAPAFAAPGDVDTIIFELVVNDGTEDSPADTVMINVLEDANVAYFVDGDNGSDDTGNGSTLTPFASIAKALCEITADQQDIYVMTRAAGAAYDESVDPCDQAPPRSADLILTVPTGTSLYGGYGVDWVRNAATNPTLVDTLHHGFRFSAVDLNAWFSGFDVQSGNSPSPADSVYALSAIGGSASIFIHDNQLIAGDVDFGNAASPGTSYGLRVALIEAASIERNVISAGFGGDGMNVTGTYDIAAASGGNGGNASGQTRGSGGAGRAPDYYAGSAGGTGGGVFGNCNNGTTGANGSAGANGAAGSGGNGSGGIRVYEDGGFFAFYTTGNGGKGNTGRSGTGGNGGTGGHGCVLEVGGGGGGGSGGGGGGLGGPGGSGGGASIGLFIATVNTAVINNNNIASGTGGNGATGDAAQTGGAGGVRGVRALGSCTLGVCGGNGGYGGTGGKGGNGGRGGAGGGGPSYGIAVGSDIMPSISNNQITSSDGGSGGFGGNGGNGGDGGHSFAVFDDDINDGFTPALINNDLTAGLPGNGGSTLDTNTGNEGSVGQAGTINW